MQQNRIENWVLDTVSKNFVILAFLTKNQHNFTTNCVVTRNCCKINRHPYMHRQICLLSKKENVISFNEVKQRVKICISFAD